MSQLEKAQIGEVNRQGRVSAEVAVQFNPTTLRLQMTNSIDVGKSRGRQAQQYNGTSSTTLTVELEFDSSDEDEGGQPVDVRTKTEAVRKFVLPGGRNSKQAPPRVQFRWGRFVLQGVMASLNEDLDLFSPDGVPLRSKLSISIKEQDPKFEALERGSGANLPAAPPRRRGRSRSTRDRRRPARRRQSRRRGTRRRERVGLPRPQRPRPGGVAGDRGRGR